jgi:predicted dehydrogenase
MKEPHRFHSRRSFLKTSAALAAASTLPQWFLEEAAAQAPSPSPKSPNDQPGIALIGCGGMGRGDAKNASRFGKVVALCDVDDARIAEAKKMFADANTFKDFRQVVTRKDVDVVICGTVDHWHTLISMAAMNQGKDVYCEKPLTLTIDEGKHLVAAGRRTGRILQTGSQQRSDKNFRLACELVRNGRVGKLKHIDVWLPAGPRLGPFAPGPIPAGFDWNVWMGPTAQTPYVKEKGHGTFRYWWDYSGGTMTDWGAHHNDIALWALGLDRSGPVSVEGKPLVKMIPGGYTAYSEYDVLFTYENGVTHRTRSTAEDNPSGGVVQKEGQRHGIRFTGSDGWIWITRGNIQASNPDFLSQPLTGAVQKLYVSDDHMGNFFDCIRSRQHPICDVEVGHRSATVCHLGVIASRLGRKLQWDPGTQDFVGDPAASKWLKREMRKPWNYASVS